MKPGRRQGAKGPPRCEPDRVRGTRVATGASARVNERPAPSSGGLPCRPPSADRGLAMWPGSGPPRRVMPSAARRRVPLPRPDDDAGVVAVMVALLTTVFVALAALVVDHGLAADTELRAKTAADASALAAAVALANGGAAAATAADTAVRNYAQADFGVTPAEWTACTTTLPSGYTALVSTPCISQNTTTRHVRVVLPKRTFATIFAGIAGFSTQAVAGAAEATWAAPDASHCGLCVLDSLSSNTGSVTADGD